MRNVNTTTIVLVHGAFDDSGMGKEVIAKLRAPGYPTLAVANPLPGLGSDASRARVALLGRVEAAAVVDRLSRWVNEHCLDGVEVVAALRAFPPAPPRRTLRAAPGLSEAKPSTTGLF